MSDITIQNPSDPVDNPLDPNNIIDSSAENLAKLGLLTFAPEESLSPELAKYLNTDLVESFSSSLDAVTAYLDANASDLENTLTHLPDTTDPELAELLQEFAPLIGSTSDKSPSSVINFIQANASRFALQISNLKEVDAPFAAMVSQVLEESLNEISLVNASLVDFLDTMSPPKVDVTSGAPVINSWFKGSMVTALFINNQILLQSLRELKQTELYIQIASMQKSLALAKDCAALILKSADKQAWQHYTAAIAAGIGAAISFVSVVAMGRASVDISKNLSAQKREYSNKTAEAKTSYQQEVSRFSQNNSFTYKGGNSQVSAKTPESVLHNNPSMVINKQLTPTKMIGDKPGATPSQVKFDANLSKSDLNKKAVSYDKAMAEERQFDLTRSNQQVSMLQNSVIMSQAVATMCNNLVNTAKEVVTGNLVYEKGGYDALLELLRSLKEMWSKQQDSAGGQFRDAGDLTSKIVQDMNKAVDALIQAFSSLRG